MPYISSLAAMHIHALLSADARLLLRQLGYLVKSCHYRLAIMWSTIHRLLLPITRKLYYRKDDRAMRVI